MFKMIYLSAFLSVVFFGSLANAKTIKLGPNESKSLTNSSLWTLNATCTIQSNAQGKNKIKIRVLKNGGSVNGKNLASGQATMVTVRNNSSIAVSAEAGTQVNLVNLGDEGLQAVCYT